MKKVIAIGICLFALAGCGGDEVPVLSEAESQTAPSEAESQPVEESAPEPESQPAEQPTEESADPDSPEALSDEAISSLVQTMTEEGSRVFWWYHDFQNEDLEIDEQVDPIEEYYYPVGKFATEAEMKAASEQIFTKRFCEAVLYPVGFEAEGDNQPHFKEIDGQLYINSNAGGMGWIYGLTDQMTVQSQDAEQIVVTIIAIDPDEEEEPFDFTFVLEDGVWKLDNWFTFGAE